MKQIHFEVIDSTNTYLKSNYQNLENLTFVSSDYQTQGKGRSNRKWEASKDNLLFSLLLKDKRYFEQTNVISILSAFTILQVLQDYGLTDVSIKWPNDVYVKDKKICGILLEAKSTNDIECLIIGVGVNVNQKEFDKEFNATSMKNVLNKDIDINKLKEDIYQKMIDNLDMLLQSHDYYQEIVKYDYLKNKEVYALISAEKKLVTVKGMNRDYSLCVVADEQEYNLNSGEISFHI